MDTHSIRGERSRIPDWPGHLVVIGSHGGDPYALDLSQSDGVDLRYRQPNMARASGTSSRLPIPSWNSWNIWRSDCHSKATHRNGLEYLRRREFLTSGGAVSSAGGQVGSEADTDKWLLCYENPKLSIRISWPRIGKGRLRQGL